MITAELHSFAKEYLWRSQNTLDRSETALGCCLTMLVVLAFCFVSVHNLY